ncbi:MAG TPA: acyl-CoA thioester hydrolase/BAAT C-terminal domain-containing protein, partial [Chryseosolibacter sp.]|nr:acyl-CoA thioester hydrolase/BAAT C-terminal domain-containing protein [Chryseosolibacter sp.]
MMRFISTSFYLLTFMTALSCSSDSEMPERYGKVSSELFLSEGIKQPLVVGLGGSEGGNAWASDRWKTAREKFTSNGYAFLALEYFGGPTTPEALDRISIDSVFKAIKEAAMHPQIDAEWIAIVGGSKGAELALLMASHYSDIDCVVAMVPGYASFPALTMGANTSSWTYQNKEVTFVPMPWAAVPDAIAHDLRGAFTTMIEDSAAVEAARIRIANIQGPILFVSAREDEMWPSSEMSDDMMAYLKAHQFPFAYAHITDPGGHVEVFDYFDDVVKF